MLTIKEPKFMASFRRLETGITGLIRDNAALQAANVRAAEHIERLESEIERMKANA